MTYSYSETLTTDIDKVRFYLSDTTESGALFSNETIQAVLDMHGDDVLSAAAALADSLVARFSRSVSFSIEGLTIQNQQKAENYRLLAARLRAIRANAASAGALSVSGVSVAGMRSIDADTDRPASAFKVGMHDIPGLRGPGGCGEVNE